LKEIVPKTINNITMRKTKNMMVKGDHNGCEEEDDEKTEKEEAYG
jgi:hypothetical protein